MNLAPAKYVDQRDSVWSTLRRVFAATFLLWIASRTLTLLLLVIAPAIVYEPIRDLAQFERWILRAWDANWYFQIVEIGYDQFDRIQTNRAFFPLYPWTVRVIADTFSLQPVWVGTVLSNLSFWAALALLWRFCEIHGLKEESTRFAVAMLAFVPQGVVFSVMYAESLYLALGMLSVVAMYERRFILAAIAGALCAGCRPSGFLLAGFAGLLYVQSYGIRAALQFWKQPQATLPIICIPLGSFAVFWFHFITTGDAFAHSNGTSYYWDWSFHAPWETLNAFALTFDKNTIWLLLSLAAISLSLYLVRLGLWAEGLWCVASICIASLAGSVESNLRYCIVLFPLYFGIARLVGDSTQRQSIVLASWATFSGMIIIAWALGKNVI